MESQSTNRPSAAQAGTETTGQAQAAERVVFNIRGGEVVVAVPAGTPDEDAIASASSLRAALRLENERVLIVEVHRDAEGAVFHDEPAQLHGAHPPLSVAEPPLPGTAAAIMTREVLVASPDELVEDVAKRLAFHNISGMPVEDWDGRVIGVVSEFDVIGKLGLTIRDVMSSDVISVSPDTPIRQVATLMAEQRIKRVPVIKDNRLAGLVSRADIVRAIAARATASA